MWNKIKDRLDEPSTYAGLAGVILGAGQLAKVDEAPQVADLIGQAGQAAVTGDYVTAGAIGIMGLFSIFMKEKGSN